VVGPDLIGADEGHGETGRSVVLPADMVGGASAARKADLEASNEALKKFVSQVDEVLQRLEGSAGNPKRVSAQTIRASSLSSGRADVFPEAQSLYAQYNSVHEQLTTLSKTLHLHIEAIGIAVRGAAHGYATLEEDQRRRFYEIQVEVKEIQQSTSGKYTGKDESGMGA
jgi:Zn-dependent oligopeptidase